MNYKLRLLMIDFIDIINKFIVSYCIITTTLYGMDEAIALTNLGLLPIPFLSYLIQKKIKHIWSFIVSHGCILLFYIWLFQSHDLFILCIYSLYIVITAIASYYAKQHATEVKNTFYLLIIFAIFYFVLSFTDMPELAQFTFRMAILFTLLNILNLYLTNFNNFFINHSEVANIPYQQIKSSNNILVFFLGCLFLIVMLLSSNSQSLTILLRQTVKLILQFFLFLFNLYGSLFTEAPFEGNSIGEKAEEQPMMTEPSYILQLIEQILKWLILIVLIVILVTFICYAIYKLYQYFYRKKGKETSDQIEFFSPFTKKEASKKASRIVSAKRFGRTNNDKIRKHFYKAVSSSVEDHNILRKDLTAPEIAELAKLGSKGPDPAIFADSRKLITMYYEKARYSNEECSREEVKKMKELLK